MAGEVFSPAMIVQAGRNGATSRCIFHPGFHPVGLRQDSSLLPPVCRYMIRSSLRAIPVARWPLFLFQDRCREGKTG